MSVYIPNSGERRQQMLETMDLSSPEDLFQEIPRELRVKAGLKLEPAMSELELMRRMKTLAEKNRGTEQLTCFTGAGAYDRYIPSVIKHLTSRSEFYTAYTPYQPEISQGTLQAIFEFQTMIAELTGMDVANASMYDGASACAEAALMAAASTNRRRILVSRAVHPEVREVLATYTGFHGIELVEIGLAGGATDPGHLRALLTEDTAGVVLQNPNFLGIVEDLTPLEEAIHEKKALMIVNVSDPLSLALIKCPGEQKADIVVGEGQSLGINLNLGGPYLGFMAATNKLMRKLPGRIVGETTDVDGKRAFVLTLQAREQHIRREKATSNICTNQGLNALTATIYLSVMGRQGLMEAAEQSMNKAHYALAELKKAGVEPLFDKPFFNEFAVTLKEDPKAVNERLLEQGILGGYALDNELDNLGFEQKHAMLLCVTEKRTKEEIDRLVSVLAKEGK
ncbi:MAG TPA: aminomethyl-transferring glycine dehydrogenase subunit GcvPA [Bacillota bacterium]|nr:aminomethyl-transferring glycine dehydrogenase subunit GcvPA [Bacillota bacterium]